MSTDPRSPAGVSEIASAGDTHHDRVMQVLADALELEPAQRAEFLDRACAGDVALRAEVERLLGREAEAAGALATEHSAKALLDALTPRQIGPYRILRPIGEGGMGIVYQAAQQWPVKRVVALKLIRPGLDSREFIARFQSERQALALMSHPNVAQVYDAGTTDMGRPYFVMEYVAGEPITDYCDRHRLSVRQRLDLFIQVCEAVQHAHQKGIIHRDLKPSNVLVSEQTGRAVPKVIDFGTAKAAQQTAGSEATLYTQRGQLIGTPEYMSPEQAAGRGIDIDTRSDIYSLGVVLYELLTGTLPIDSRTLRDSGYQEIQRMIREVDPPSPSRRLSALGSELADPAARARRTDVGALRRQIRGDLDWIVMRAMEKDRTRRYDSAGALAADVQRYLRDEPVLAGPPSSAYLLRKFARRHRTVLASAALLAGVLIAATVVSSWLAIRARRAEAVAVANEAKAKDAERVAIDNEQKARANEQRAQQEAARSAQVAAFLSDMLQGVAPAVAKGRDTTLLREILDRTAERIGTDLKEVPLVEADLRTTLGQTYYGLGMYSQSQEMGAEALRLRREQLGEKHPDVAAAMNALAATLLAMGDLDGSEALLRHSLALRRELFGESSMIVAESLNNLASLLRARGDLPGAEEHFRQTAALVESLTGPEDPRLATAFGNLSGVLRLQYKFDDAEHYCRRALEIRRTVHGELHPNVAASLNSLAVLLLDKRDLDGAEPVLHETLALRRRLLGEKHPDISESLHNLSRLYDARQDHERALDYAQQAADMRRDLFGETSTTYAQSLFEVAYQQQALGRPDRAEQKFRQIIGIFESSNQTQDQVYALGLQRLGRLMIETDRVEEARALFERSLEAYSKTVAPDDWRLGYSKVLIGGALARLAEKEHPSAGTKAAELERAEKMMLEGYRAIERYPRPPVLSKSYAANELARFYEANGMPQKAVEWHQRAGPPRTPRRPSSGPSPPTTSPPTTSPADQ